MTTFTMTITTLDVDVVSTYYNKRLTSSYMGIKDHTMVVLDSDLSRRGGRNPH